YTGLEAANRRLEEHNQDETERKNFLEDEVKQFVPAAVEVELTNKPDWTSSSNTLTGEFNLKVPGWASSAGRRALIPVGLFTSSEKHVFDHATRVNAIYFEYPSEKRDDITVELPAGWSVSNAPAPVSQDGHIVNYTLKVDSADNKLHWTRDL